MNLWMFVMRQMNFAIDLCEGNIACPAEDEFCIEMPGLHSWDKAVAYYTGSLSSNPDVTQTRGKLLYNMANEECSQFKTCGDGEARVNTEIFDNFRAGQQMIIDEDCDGARAVKEAIVSLMTIPLIQGTLRYAHLLADEEEDWEPYEAEAAAYASSVLPLLHTCDPESAQIVHENLQAQSFPEVDFVAVKRALERTYPCLKISCQQVGGIENPFTGGYLDGAEPCIELFGGFTVDVDDSNKSTAIGLTVAILTLFVLGIVVCLVRRSTEKRIEQLKNQHLDGTLQPEAEIL